MKASPSDAAKKAHHAAVCCPAGTDPTQVCVPNGYTEPVCCPTGQTCTDSPTYGSQKCCPSGQSSCGDVDPKCCSASPNGCILSYADQGGNAKYTCCTPTSDGNGGTQIVACSIKADAFVYNGGLYNTNLPSGAEYCCSNIDPNKQWTCVAGAGDQHLCCDVRSGESATACLDMNSGEGGVNPPSTNPAEWMCCYSPANSCLDVTDNYQPYAGVTAQRCCPSQPDMVACHYGGCCSKGKCASSGGTVGSTTYQWDPLNRELCCNSGNAPNTPEQDACILAAYCDDNGDCHSMMSVCCDSGDCKNSDDQLHPQLCCPNPTDVAGHIGSPTNPETCCDQTTYNTDNLGGIEMCCPKDLHAGYDDSNNIVCCSNPDPATKKCNTGTTGPLICTDPKDYPACYGTCPTGQICQNILGACQCAPPTTCDQATLPACYGTCSNPYQACTANAGVCSCQNYCEWASEPACGGHCNSGGTCQYVPNLGCRCE